MLELKTQTLPRDWISGLGLTGALSDNFSPSGAVRLSRNERKVQEKPLSGCTCPLDIYPVECVCSLAMPECGCCSRILLAMPKASPIHSGHSEGAEGSPQPLFAGRPPTSPSCLCSSQEEGDMGSHGGGRSVIQRHSCGSVGIEPSPASRAGRKSEQTFLGKEEQGSQARVNKRWEQGVGRRGHACQPADSNGLWGGH